MEYYVHDLPGRLRIRTPFVKRNPAMADAIRRLLETAAGVGSISINTVTGSIVIYYNPKEARSKKILSLLERAGYFDRSRAMTNDQYIYRATSTVGKTVWRALFGAAVETALEGSALSMIAILI